MGVQKLDPLDLLIINPGVLYPLHGSQYHGRESEDCRSQTHPRTRYQTYSRTLYQQLHLSSDYACMIVEVSMHPYFPSSDRTYLEHPRLVLHHDMSNYLTGDQEVSTSVGLWGDSSAGDGAELIS